MNQIFEIYNSKYPIFNITQISEEKSKKKFVMYENLLCDVTKYAEDHPGGKNMIKENFFSDISRYIIGNQGYSSKVSAYDHNFQTCEYAIKNLAYAIFLDDHKIVLKKDTTAYLNHDMVFESKIEIAENSSQLNFSHEGFKFPIFLPGTNWNGRHFAVSSIELNKTRYYSLCLCMNTIVQDKIKILFENIKNLENQESIKDCSINPSELYSDNFSLYVKSYNFPKGLAKYLHSIKPKSTSGINIRGPIVNLFFLILGNWFGNRWCFKRNSHFHCRRNRCFPLLRLYILYYKTHDK